MKAHGHSFRKGLYHLVLFTVICALMFGISRVFAEEDFRIRSILQSESDSTVVAFTVSGVFQENDVVNLYSNGSFIKSKVITEEENIGEKRITVGNISVDTFRNGLNEIVAKIEREGVELLETPVFQLTIQEPLEAPSVSASFDAGSVVVIVSGTVREGDVVAVFLDGVELRSRTVTADDASRQEVRVVGISEDDLRIGDNFFEARITRGGRESSIGRQTEPLVLEEEVVVPVISDGQCTQYTVSQDLTLSDGSTQDQFGKIVAADGATLVVDTDTDTVHVYRKGETGVWGSNSVITEQGYSATRSFDRSIVSDGDTVIIGTPYSSYGSYLTGAVQIYGHAGDSWVPQSILTTGNLTAYESFGSQVAVSNTLLAVSARQRDDSGVVYVYTRDGVSWVSSVRFVPADSTREQRFGHSVSVEDSLVAIGAPGDRSGAFDGGAVYVHAKEGGEWVMTKIVPSAVNEGDVFGTVVLLRDGVLFVGTPGDDESGNNAGSVHVYEQSDGLWRMVQKIVPESGTRGRFGSSLAYTDGVLAVGVPEHGAVRSGAVHVYERSGSVWSLQKTVLPIDGMSGDHFGSSVAFDGLDLIIGAYGTDGEKRNIGTVYVFKKYVVPCGDVIEEENISMPVFVSPEDVLDLLEEKRTVLEQLIVHVSSLVDGLIRDIQETRRVIGKQSERIVLFDERVVSASAQKRAAQRRGVIAPGLPDPVVVERVVVGGILPRSSDSIRSRDAVVSETRDGLGIVVPTTDKYLRVGDADEEVYRLQVFLNENGYIIARSGPGSPGNEASTFGSSTERALKSFQLVNGILVTGVLDIATRNVILRYVSDF